MALQTPNAAAAAFAAGASRADLTLTSGPSFTPNADGSITGAATAQLATKVISAMGFRSLSFSVTATAKIATRTASTATANKLCILVLDPTAAQALLVNGNFNITAPNCEIDVASTANPAAIFNSGDAINVQNVCIHGANIIRNSVTVPNLTLGCAVASDPFAGKLPAVANAACTVTNQNYSGTNVLSPGVYCGGFNFNGSGTLNLQPGLYVFKGANWNLEQRLDREGDRCHLLFRRQFLLCAAQQRRHRQLERPDERDLRQYLDLRARWLDEFGVHHQCRGEPDDDRADLPAEPQPHF